MARDLRLLVRVALECKNWHPKAVIFDNRTLQSTPEIGTRAGYNGYTLRNGSQIHMAVDALGNCPQQRGGWHFTSIGHTRHENQGTRREWRGIDWVVQHGANRCF